MERNVFFKVTKNNEDSVTELLINLFQIQYLKELILSYLGIENSVIKNIGLLNIDTQINYNGFGRPDIIISTKESLIFIENKIYIDTPLQETQKTTYIDQLKYSKKTYVKMIYLIPEKYIHIEDINSVVSKNDFCKIITWEGLLTYLYEKEVYKWNDVIGQSLEHVSQLVIRKEPKNHLSVEEIVVMLNTKDLIITNSLFAKSKTFINCIDRKIIPLLGEYFDHSSWSLLDNEYELGKYFRYENKMNLFLGYSFGLLNEHPDKTEYLFSFAINTEIINKDKIKVSTKKYFINDEWYFFKLNKYLFSNFDNPDDTVDEIIEIINSSI